ncbi:hypothetical protein CROQUDRAFT_723191 [Cronartium quercuum f. sp. fusiforme G11]|uniref:serine C-palmitoyltransferase n=1 Tax=Cronartium quercuum f. sp. fusiforme G11 TaxID=708437 RepID=A0A9P6TBP8_9BASI|nr:hypothetical protein CROQUDRAFT_723191 [Cronartium quercuum f. sp. fusiforme G11]
MTNEFKSENKSSSSSPFTKLNPLSFSTSTLSDSSIHSTDSIIDSPISIIKSNPKTIHQNILSDLPPKSVTLAKLKPIIAFDPFDQAQQQDRFGLKHSEFGFDGLNQNFRWVSQFKSDSEFIHVTDEEPGYWIYLSTYFSYLILIILGHIRDFFGKRFKSESFQHLMPNNGYAALNSDFDSFYTRRLKARMEDCFARPVTGVAGRTINLIERTTLDYCKSFQFTGNIKQALNISSYNYLGFAQSKGLVNHKVEHTINDLSISVGGTRSDVGNLLIHLKCEKLISNFLGVEDSLIVSQGFATNSSTLPSLASKGTLIISDEFNHSSIRFGSRLSGALVRQYKHNDMFELENLLRESISQGQPRTHRPWKKIIVVVEGIYSMEGTIVNLPALYALKATYKFYLYVDEAHSIGALGPHGKGVCDYFGLDPSGCDILMGTLTKSFGASGGYIAGKKSIIESLRYKNHSNIYSESMSAPVVQQIISSLSLIIGQEEELKVAQNEEDPKMDLSLNEGKERLRRLAFNARYLSSGLRKLGFIVYGNRDSPIIPLLIFNPGKMLQFSRMMLERYSIVIVVVAYPATPLVSSRVRFCVSASHTKFDLDKVLIACDEIGDILGLKLSKNSNKWSIDQVIDRWDELVQD